MQRLTAATILAITASGEQVIFDENLTHAEKVNILKFRDVSVEKPKAKPENKIFDFVKVEREIKEAGEGAVRTEPWV